MKSISPKIFLLCAILVFGGLGCKGLSQAEQANVRPASIEYWTVFNDLATLRQFASQYTAAKPHISINIRQIRPEEFEERLVNALADDLGPDIISIHAKDIGKYVPRLDAMPRSTVSANVFVKGQYVKETVIQQERHTLPSATNIRQNYVGAVAEDVIRGASIYGLPLAIDALALYYNKDLLDKAGIPTPPSTWGEFTEAVKTATKVDALDNVLQSGVALGTANNISNAPDILALLMMQNNVRVTQTGIVGFTQGLESGVEESPAGQALRFYTDFARPTRDTYSWQSTQPEAFDAFVRGQSVFYIGYAYDFERIKAQAPQMNLAVVELPQLNSEQPSNVANYWVESVLKKSDAKEAAWDFIYFMTTAENTEKYSQAVGIPSPLRVHVASQIENPVLAPFASQILTARTWYQGNNSTVAEQVMTDLIEGYLRPYPEGLAPEKRDGDLIIRAARTMQQTM